ncbi:hypothetical protein BRC72_12850 [Halobacteriales archaeon QH_7_66_36]|nr:MAG: hypothetical protein BRC72_12850 [Halobacteriales archaeon QH_7_66_36]
MSAEQDISLDEKRVYAGGSARSAFVASEAGLARVSVSDDLVGEFGLTIRDATSDIVADDGRVAVATETDALVATEDGFAETGFGSADAVGFADGLIACGEGRVARYDDGTWIEIGKIDGVRAVASDLLAADGGVYRPDGTHVGLDDARDVAVGSSVFAATGDGLYALANGWMQRLDGAIRAVATNAGRAVAVADGTLYERRDGEWTAVGAPGDVADAVPMPDALYAVTTDGTFLANAGDGWRDRTLGLQGCRRLTVVDGDS